MRILVFPQLRSKLEHLSTTRFLAHMLLLTFNASRRAILTVKFYNMPLHVTLKSKFTLAVLNWTLKDFSLVLKKMTVQMVLSSISRTTIIDCANIWPL